MFWKKRREENKDCLDEIRSMECSVCGAPPPSDAHHMKTKGSGGGDTLENLVSLCRKHHQEIHTLGRKTWWIKRAQVVNEFRRAWGLPPLNYD